MVFFGPVEPINESDTIPNNAGYRDNDKPRPTPVEKIRFDVWIKDSAGQTKIVGGTTIILADDTPTKEVAGIIDYVLKNQEEFLKYHIEGISILNKEVFAISYEYKAPAKSVRLLKNHYYEKLEAFLKKRPL